MKPSHSLIIGGYWRGVTLFEVTDFMNWQVIEGKWNQIKGSIKEKWGDFTDDEISQIEGNRDKFVGKLQEKYGMAKEEAERAADNWADRTDSGQFVNDAWNRVTTGWGELSGRFKENFGKLTDDALMESEGRRDRLASMVQREYGISRGQALEMIDDWAYGSHETIPIR